MSRSERANPAVRVSPSRPPSIEDVAAAADVSTATVSRYINSPKLLAPGTAERVAHAIAKLGYRPNRFAQGLMTSRSQTVGIVLPDIHGEFYSELLRGANAEARRSGYHLLVTSGVTGDNATQTIDSGTFGLVDGLALMITEPNDALWHAALKTGLPIVTLDTDPGEPDVDSILIDNATGTAEAVAHLLGSVPPDRCYFVGGPRDNFDTAQRAAAFCAALVRAGHKVKSEQVAYGNYSPEWGRTWASLLAAKPPKFPIGVMAGDDEIAYGIIDAAAIAGIAVPRDLRVVGFDDSRLAALLRPALSSVRVPLLEVGAAVIAALVHRINEPGSPVVSRTLTTRLIIRDSSRA